MKISYSWLNNYIKSDLSIEQTTNHLTDLGLEVEGTHFFESLKGGLEGVVVGEIMTCIQHPNADRLKLTKVKINKSETIQIICGAPNVEKGQKVPVALVGSKLFSNKGFEIIIKSTKIRGEESHGMICAEDELGLGDSHDGIMILDNNIITGTPCKEIFDVVEDYIIDIGLTPNRSDAMSHFGVARDLRAALMHKNKSLELITPSVSSFHVNARTKKINICN